MNVHYAVAPWGVPFAFHEMSAEVKLKVVNRIRQHGTLMEGMQTNWRSVIKDGRVNVVDERSFQAALAGFRMTWPQAMWVERQVLGLADVDAMVAKIKAALEGRTKTFSDELRLHKEIHDALVRANIPHDREVPIPEAGRIDFIAWACIAIEVKAKTGGGRGPLRQLFRYLEDPRFEGGVILSTKKVELPLETYEAADGRRVAVRKIELWKNAL